MNYRAVNRRIAIDPSEHLPKNVPVERAREILETLGFRTYDIDIIDTARWCIGHARYQRGAHPGAAPGFVDCSSLVRWVYGEIGIWLPRRSIQQFEMGAVVKLGQRKAGDLIFQAGSNPYYHQDRAHGIGHVGIVTDDDTVIHAAGSERGVVEDPITDFTDFRGIRRYLTPETVTLRIPPGCTLEVAAGLRWIIYQQL